MNLDQLEAIQAIVEQGSFRAAAQHLHRSQPALSASVKNLEEEFGIELFDRNEYRPSLTEAGSIFLHAAKATLDAAHHAARIAAELGQKKAETKLRISLDPLVPLDAIELIAQECARPVVPVTLILEKTILHTGVVDLLSGKVDLALAPLPQENSQVEKIVIERVTLLNVVSRKLLQEKRTANEAFLGKHAQILLYDKSYDETPDPLMPKTLFEGGPKIFVPDHFTKVQLIRNGVGWGRISEKDFASDKSLVAIDKKVCPYVELELCLLRPKNRAIGPIARVIWKAFGEKCASINRRPKN
ncbi:MAG: LysR family transcriptional regulator [Bdellovibrionota bacterium]